MQLNLFVFLGDVVVVLFFLFSLLLLYYFQTQRGLYVEQRQQLRTQHHRGAALDWTGRSEGPRSSATPTEGPEHSPNTDRTFTEHRPNNRQNTDQTTHRTPTEYCPNTDHTFTEHRPSNRPNTDRILTEHRPYIHRTPTKQPAEHRPNTDRTLTERCTNADRLPTDHLTGESMGEWATTFALNKKLFFVVLCREFPFDSGMTPSCGSCWFSFLQSLAPIDLLFSFPLLF